MYVNGAITVKVITGRNGDFAVGMLTTPFGQFETKGPLLDQYPAGNYEGRFDLAEIYIDSYRTGQGQFFTKLCCRVTDLIIDEKDEVPEPADMAPTTANESIRVDPLVEAGVIRDHLDETDADAPPPGTPDPSQQNPQPSKAKADTEDLASLFGDLWPLVAAKSEVQLDPAAGNFRLQMKALKAAGYRYDPHSRTWHNR